ncbi:DXO/RAI1 family decapping nuclease KNAG_0D02970 [Huiozyma naganishii CBS 8797]|uniref:Decapping nuclease n=1 Tax=Huiozyma naganishii (strain ATCC MYA-139 / BCRC 22969 / CBS 8797 / KCTC 17520 / NBRC 10181 / NCYC 3082 / Yp74L-3) TaxID=1071383 RepID=J7S714_HUIN7|nr:hypothetical protein KNAG_0D02970 [Kazachstania naganishii CBS 8797]CCK70046.1 hypothetical protein KNAG_0D02970 [Kazachstania naganishii CBS 8797]
MQWGLSLRERGDTTTLRQPRELGCYSRTASDEVYVNDDRNLSYYYFPDELVGRQFNLSHGFERFQDRNRTIRDTCSLRGLLGVIQDVEEKRGKRLSADIVTFRGIIRKVISAAIEPPRRNDRPLELQVLVFDGQVFIKDVAYPERDSVTVPSFTGYKFETLTTIPRPLPYMDREAVESRFEKTVGNGDEYAIAVTTGIGACKMVLGAEVDGVFDFKEHSDGDADGPVRAVDNLQHYLELKCTMDIRNEADAAAFEGKMFRTWLQCFLVGVPRIIYGFRNRQYLLQTVEEYTTADIPQMVGSHNPQLHSAFRDAIRWYGRFTEWLLQVIPRGDRQATTRAYRLVSDPRVSGKLQLIEVPSGSDEYTEMVNNEEFLNSGFKEWRRSLW